MVWRVCERKYVGLEGAEEQSDRFLPRWQCGEPAVRIPSGNHAGKRGAGGPASRAQLRNHHSHPPRLFVEQLVVDAACIATDTQISRHRRVNAIRYSTAAE